MPPATDREHINIVIVGHVDHGKSTVVGRLLADTGIAAATASSTRCKRECERTGKPFEYAFLLDALSDEQDQGITIDTARSFFKTATRDYIIIDAPGHIEFLKNMISGAARAEAAVLVIDAKEGVRENSRRHGYILSMLGIRQVIVVRQQDGPGQVRPGPLPRHRDRVPRVPRGHRRRQPAPLHPRRRGEGRQPATRSAKQTSWYEGPTLLEALDKLPKAPPKTDQPLRMPVQAVYKFTEHGDDRRIFAGRVEAGKVAVGDKVVFSPSNKITTIKSIEAFNAAPRTSIDAGWSTGFTLTEEIYVTRGEVMSQVDKPPLVSTRIAHEPDLAGQEPVRRRASDYKLKLGTAAVPVQHRTRSTRSSTPATLDRRLEKDSVGRHDVADVVLETRQPIAFDLTADCEATGRFVIVDGYDVAGGGIITAAVADELRDLRAEARTRDFNWVEGGVTAADRAHRAGHREALVMFVGKSGAGKHRYARALERALFDAGRNAYMLDGQNVLLGVDSDLLGRRRAVRAGAPLRRGRAHPARRRPASSCRRPTPSASRTRPPCRR